MYSGIDRRVDDEASAEDSEVSSLSGSDEQSGSGSGSESDSGIDHRLPLQIHVSISVCPLKRIIIHVTSSSVAPTSTSVVLAFGNVVAILSAFESACCS